MYTCLFYQQIDFIDLRHHPDGQYMRIAHYIDHWSKHQVLFPLTRKSAAEVAFGICTHVFYFFGTPKLLHSDNGEEFVTEIIADVVSNWPGEIVIINGRPRNPQYQGLVEQLGKCHGGEAA